MARVTAWTWDLMRLLYFFSFCFSFFGCRVAAEMQPRVSSLLCLEHLAGSVALSPSELNQIATEGQTCAFFGIHARLPLLKELYDLGEAAFISNVGSLAAPVSKVQWESGAGERHLALGSLGFLDCAARMNLIHTRTQVAQASSPIQTSSRQLKHSPAKALHRHPRVPVVALRRLGRNASACVGQL